MVQAFQPLSLHRLESGTGYFHPKHRVANSQPFMQCVPHDPAVRAMTDFSRTTPCLTELSTPIGDARAILIQRRIRMLLVHDANDHMIGLLTSRDLDGEKSERILTKVGGAWDDLRVVDLMTICPKVQSDDDLSKSAGGFNERCVERTDRRHHRHLAASQPPAHSGG